jgi:hemolysin activation/secretion protein
MRRAARRVTAALAMIGIGVFGAPAYAQVAAPSQFTPQSLRPSLGPRNTSIALQEQPSLASPPGAEGLSVQIGSVSVDGGFTELTPQIDTIIRQMAGKRLTVDQIYGFARAIEQLHVDAGYPLVRVVVPAQNLVDLGKLVFVVVDGFIEFVDVAGVPERVREEVALRAGLLVGLRHIRLAAIERCLLIAGDIPGLRLRSTLIRGAANGSTRLVLEGEHQVVTATLGGDNRLAASLGTWQLKGTVGINGALGLGEQIYLTAGASPEPNSVFAGRAPLAVYGGGVVVPVGTNGMSLNPEFTRSETRTAQAPGVPATSGTFERYALRLRDPVLLSRSASLNMNTSVEYITQQVDAPGVGVTLNRDQYWAVRTGPDYITHLPWGGTLQLGTSLSVGLGGRSEAQAIASGVPLSRTGAASDFAKITGYGRISQPLPFQELCVTLVSLGQFSMGKPMLRSEQFALDGADALSAFAAGTFSVDEGATLRGELSRPFAAKFDAANVTVSPYLFGAAGRGWLADATSVEQSVINASAVGFGARGLVDTGVGWRAFSFGLELARQFADVPGLRQGWRGNVNAAMTF